MLSILRRSSEIYIYGDHSNSEMLYFYFWLGISGFINRFRGFILSETDARQSVAAKRVYGQQLLFLETIVNTKKKTVLITDRKLDNLPDNIQTILLPAEEISNIRNELAKMIVAAIENENRPIMLYGAGEYAAAVFQCISAYIDVSHMLISGEPKSGENLMGIPVMSSKNPDISRDALVLIATDERKHSEIINTLSQLGYERYLPLSIETALILYERFLLHSFESEDVRYRLLKPVTGTAEFYITAKDRKDDYRFIPHWRLRTNNIIFWEKTLKFLTGNDLEAQYEGLYGNFISLRAELLRVDKSGNQRLPSIYMAQSIYDVGIDTSNFPGYLIPVHAGAGLTEKRIARLCDNEGDNISAMNIYFSEMTVFYWIWKNISLNLPYEAYVGLCHYRRHFDADRGLLEKLANSDIDIVLTCPEINVNGNLNYYLANGAIKKPVADILFEVIESRSPEYLPFVRSVAEGCMLHPFNMCIMRSIWLNRYCQWVFRICEEVHCHCLERGLEEKRYLGYITELLLPAFCAKHKNVARIAIADRIMMN